MQIEHALFHPDTLLERWKAPKTLHSFRAKLKILGYSANNDRFHHNHCNIEIGPSEHLRPIFGTKNRILEIGVCERSFIQAGANWRVSRGNKFCLNIFVDKNFISEELKPCFIKWDTGAEKALDSNVYLLPLTKLKGATLFPYWNSYHIGNIH